LVLVALAVAALVAAPSPQAAGQEGTVTGTLRLNKTPGPLAHVYARAEPSLFDKNTEDIHVLFSDVPLTDADRADTFALIHLARDGKARILEVIIDASGTPIGGAIFAREFDGMVSIAGIHVFARQQLDRTTIAGRLSTREPGEFMNVAFEYDARFSAPIPRPPTAAEVAAALASPPAVAATEHLAALRAGDLAAFLATLTPASAAAFGGGEASARLRAMRDDMPADSRVVGLVPQSDGTVLATIEGHEAGVVIGHTLRMVREGGEWKVLLPLAPGHLFPEPRDRPGRLGPRHDQVVRAQHRLVVAAQGVVGRQLGGKLPASDEVVGHAAVGLHRRPQQASGG
jgi:hypothetical protein